MTKFLTIILFICIAVALSGQGMVMSSPDTTKNLLLDTYGTNIEAAYSLRKLDKDYMGACIEIERSSNNETHDIYFIGEHLDDGAVEAFCNGTTCKIETWYDQSGNNRDAIETTHANQPTIYASGAIKTENNRPAIDWTGDDQELEVSGTSTFNFMHGTGESSVAWVGRAGDSGNPNDLHAIYGNGCLSTTCIGSWFVLDDRSGLSNESAGIWAVRGVSTQYTFRAHEDNTFTPNVQLIYFFHTDNDNGTAADRVEGFEDNVDQTLDNTYTNAGTASNATNTMKIGSVGNGLTAHSFRGTMQSLIFWSTDKSSDRTSIYNNQDAYWRP